LPVRSLHFTASCHHLLELEFRYSYIMSAEIVAKYKDVDPFLLKKWERIFNAFFDRNASHEVDWHDFYMVTKKVRDIYGAESAQMTYAKSSLKALWEGLVNIADKDKNKIITIDEWIQLLKAQDPSNPKSEPKWFNDYLTFLFKLFDVSEDALLDLAEYTDGMSLYGFEYGECHEAFKLFALDKKGKKIPAIDNALFIKYSHEYFFSKDKKAIGNTLFGIFE
jgi:hypothetical protein